MDNQIDAKNNISDSEPKNKLQTKTQMINLNNLKVGFFGSIFAQPLEVLRTSSIILNKDIQNINFSGLWHLTKHVYQLEGIQGFFRGSSLAVMQNTASAMIFFTGLENITHFTNQIFQINQNTINGQAPTLSQFLLENILNFSTACASQLVTSLSISPFNVLQTRFEVVGMNQYTSVKHAILQTYQTQGLVGFYRGIIPTLLRDVPWSGLQFAFYMNIIKAYEFITGQQHSDSQIFVSLAGAVSSVTAVMIVYPFDNIRVRQQYHTGQRLQLIKTINEIYNNQGIQGFYKGYLPRILKKALSGALLWTLYQGINKNQSVTSLKNL